MIDHDALFKAIIREFFLEFLELFFPDLAHDIVPGSIQEKEQELTTDLMGGTTKRVDLIRQVQLNDEPNLILILIEPQSYNEKEFGERLFRYFIRLYEKYRLAVIPIAILSYDKPKKAAANTYKIGTKKFNTVTFNYLTIQLNQLDWQDFVNKSNPIACAFMSKMKMAKGERVDVKLTSLSEMTGLGLNPAQMQLISAFVDTYLPLNDTEKTKFERKLAGLEPHIQEEVMELVTSWMREGMAKGKAEGIAEGLKEGLREGERKLLLRLLNRRFGNLTTQEEAQLGDLNEEQLEQLGQDFLDFKSRDELTTWLSRIEK